MSSTGCCFNEAIHVPIDLKEQSDTLKVDVVEEMGKKEKKSINKSIKIVHTSSFGRFHSG